MHRLDRHGARRALRRGLRHDADADIAFDQPAHRVETAQLHAQAQRPADAHRLAGEETLQGAGAIQRFLADKAGRVGRPLKLRVQLRSFDAVCRLVERNVGLGIVPASTVRWAADSMAIKAVELTDAWALRELTICVREFNALPAYAQQLVAHMRARPN